MASTASISGLVSGLDTATLITQLMQLEAQPQNLLKSKLSDTQADAAAYRDINTKFDALRSAAEALGTTATWAAAKASSSSTGVVATASATAPTGSTTFNVTQLATTHSVLSTATWTNSTDAFGMSSPLVVSRGGTSTSIAVSADATLDDVVTAINAGDAGVRAAAVKTTTGYRLQLTSTAIGGAGAFTLTAGGPATDFPPLTEGVDATVHVGPAGGGYDVASSSNSFSELIPGVTLTVSQTGPATVTVASDPDAVATAVQSLVTAANNALSAIVKYTDSGPGATSAAVLKGDTLLQGLTGRVLDAVANAVGSDGSAARAGLQLTKDGQITFDKATFVNQLKSDPALAQRLANGTDGYTDSAGVAVPATPGVAQRLLAVAKAANDKTTGTLTLLATSEDSLAKDLQDQIAAWDVRLQQRQDTLTAQFTAMETALSTLKSQSSWLAAQLQTLPTVSSSKN